VFVKRAPVYIFLTVLPQDISPARFWENFPRKILWTNSLVCSAEHHSSWASCSYYRVVKISRLAWSRDHFFGLGLGLGLGLTVTGLGLGLGLMKCWSRSHTLWSRGLKSILCFSSVMTFDCVPCSVNTSIWMNILLVGNHCHYRLFIVYYFKYIIDDKSIPICFTFICN